MSQKTKQMTKREPDRFFDSFPAGEQCDATIDDFPNEAEEYFESKHFTERRAERIKPRLTETVLDQLLNNSMVRRSDRDGNERYLFQKKMSGYWSASESEREEKSCVDYPDHEWTIVVAENTDSETKDEYQWALVSCFSNFHGSVGTTNKYFDRYKKRKEGE